MLALALVLLLWYKKKILLLPAAALGIGALFLLPESLQARFLSMLDFSNASASGRFVLWSECLAVWKDHWLLGIGLGPENFSAAYAPYATGLLDFQPPHSNMLYLEMFLSTGIVGGLLFCGFFFGISCGRAARCAPGPKSGTVGKRRPSSPRSPEPRSAAFQSISGFTRAFSFSGAFSSAWRSPFRTTTEQINTTGVSRWFS